jgi:hypothetical protein
VTDFAALLRELAVPRLVGTPNHAHVREILKRELRARGFSVDENPFTATADRLNGVALAGAALACGAIGAIVLRFISHHPIVAFGWVITILALVLHLVLTAGAHEEGQGVGSVQGVNLIARRSDGPGIWLAAHYDSKGQPISMATRLVAVGLCAIGTLGLIATVVASLGLIAESAFAVLFVAPALVGGLLLALNRVTDDSPGAVDNASALVTVFAILDSLPGRPDVGVLFPDAEELGLLGARALVAERGALLVDTVVVNFDGIDDTGGTIAVLHRSGPIGRAVAETLGADRAPWLPVVVDGIQLARGTRECLTLMRGAWSTARIVHTPRDTADRLTLEGVRNVAAGVARVLGAN